MVESDTHSNDFFTLRLPRPEEIPELRTLLTTFFESGEFGRDLSFGELEIQDYLDWFLPRALLDCSNLLYVLEFLPRSSSRTYKTKLIGCCYIALGESSSAPKRPQNIGTLKLRMINTISDIQVWPNRQAAEVHRRIQRALHSRTELRSNRGTDGNKAHLLFAAIQEKYRGVGLGTRMVSWATQAVKELGCESLMYIGNAKDVDFMQQCGISSVRMGDMKSPGAVKAS